MITFVPYRENAQYANANGKVYTLWPEGEALLRESPENSMRQQILRQNLNLSLMLLTGAPGATRANLEKLIVHKGDSVFDNYIARYRIRKFCQLVKNGNIITLKDAFTRLGLGIILLLWNILNVRYALHQRSTPKNAM